MSGDEKKTKLDLERIVFIGRTYEEYMRMFLLSEENLKGKRILDCPAGACSFSAVGSRLGLDITACDIAYDHSPEDLKLKGLLDVDHAMGHVEKVKGKYQWTYFNDVEELRKHRLEALHDSTEGRVQNPDRYIPVTLPALPFKDLEFDILLSAHFLFMYADRLDVQFHIDTLKEMLRVTKEEIRIFPLVDLAGERYEQLDELICFLEGQKCTVEEIKVPYEFQTHANSMVRITKML